MFRLSAIRQHLGTFSSSAQEPMVGSDCVAHPEANSLADVAVNVQALQPRS